MKKKFFSGGRLRRLLTSASERAQLLHRPTPEEARPVVSRRTEGNLYRTSLGYEHQHRQASHKGRPFFLVIPFRDHEIDEFIYSRRLGAWSIGLRNDDFGDGRDCFVLLGLRVFSTAAREVDRAPPEIMKTLLATIAEGSPLRLGAVGLTSMHAYSEKGQLWQLTP